MNTPQNQARGQNFHALHQNWYEFPDADALEAWTYTTEFTYEAGQRGLPYQFHLRGVQH